MNMGPGQAPTKAQPNPKILPPKRAFLYSFAFSGRTIGFPSVVFILNRLLS